MIRFIYIALIGLTFWACQSSSGKSAIESKTVVVDGISHSTFKVWGNCGMCKETIEGSLKAEGIKEANWDMDSKMMEVVYDSTTITLSQIQKNIAAVGYDTPNFTADSSSYGSLHKCCKYDRK